MGSYIPKPGMSITYKKFIYVMLRFFFFGWINIYIYILCGDVNVLTGKVLTLFKWNGLDWAWELAKSN